MSSEPRVVSDCSLVLRLDGQEWSIHVPLPATIGREENNTVVIPSTKVSRQHARLELLGQDVAVVDLGSSNGTRVNGLPIPASEPRVLRAGDEITVGEATIEVTPGAAFVPTVAPAAPPPQPSPLPQAPAYEPVAASPRQATGLPPADGAWDDGGAHTIVTARASSLVVQTPAGSATYALTQPEVTLGRGPENAIVIDDAVVSSQHALIRATPAGHEIFDLGSRNGLRAGGAPVQVHLLRDGDVVRIGSTVSLHYISRASLPEALQDASLDLRDRQSVTIGREHGSDILVPHPAVSRRHARVSRAPGGQGYVVEDLGSSNGTYVNGVRLVPGTALTLGEGDAIQVGPARFVARRTSLERMGSHREIALDAVHLHQQVSPTANLLQDLSLSIRPREFVAIVGVSGAGKSTLMAALSGFRPATKGAVLLNGIDLYDNFNAFRSTLGYVPQDDILHKELPVERALDYAAQLRLPSDTTEAERKQRVTEVIETLGLQERRDVPVGRLSGGQRKRVSIGAELITEPGLFFLDEATSGLDPGTELQLMHLLKELANNGHTIVLITHATKNVALCDQVIFLARGGHLAYYGPPTEALPYFGVEDFDGIYQKLESESTPEAWGQRFRQSPQYEEYVARRLGGRLDGGAATRAKASDASRPRQPKVSSFKQLAILTRRQLDIIMRDRTTLLLLLLVAPILGVNYFLTTPRDVFTFESGDGTRAITVLFLSALFAFMVGSMTSVREIVKEGPIYQRERTVTLRIWPYLASKLSVGLLFSLYWSATLLVLKLLAVDFPDLAPGEIAQLYVTILLTAMSGVTVALVVSAVVKREEQAMLAAVGLIVLQVVFSGALVPLSDLGPPGRVLGSVTSAHWALEGMADSTDLQTGDCDLEGTLETCRVPGVGAFEGTEARRIALFPTIDRYGDVLGTSVYTAWAWMGGILAVLLVVLFVVQKRKDVV